MTGITPCKPTKFLIQCRNCQRYTTHLPDDPEHRGAVVMIDATTVHKRGPCPMYERTPTVYVWQERRQYA